MQETIISPENMFALSAFLFAICAFGAWSERTAIGRSISGAMVVIILAMTFSNLNIIPRESPVFSAVWTIFVPVAIGLFLIKADLITILQEGGRILLAFCFGALGVFIGGVIGLLIIGASNDYAQFAAIITASFTGGGLNFAAVATALGYEDMSELAALLAIDTVISLFYFILLGVFARSAWVRALYSWRNNELTQTAPRQLSHSETRTPQILDLAGALALSCTVVALSNWAAATVGLPGYEMLFITVFMVALATIGRDLLSRVQGEDVIAMLIMYLFFAMLGAGADIASMMDAAPSISILAATILIVHALFLLIAGRLLKLNYAELVIASLACIGGPPIAAAFAILLKWGRLAAPGIFVGVFGYVIGTFIGIGFYTLFGGMAR